MPPAPYQMPVQRAYPGQLVREGRWYVPAGFWLRVGAFLIDMVILLGVHSLLVWITGIKQPTTEQSLQLFRQFVDELMRGGMFSQRTLEMMGQYQRPAQLAGWLNVATCAAYFTFFNGLVGASFGKLALGLRVLRQDGRLPGVGLAFLRYLGYFIVAKLAYTAWLIPFDSQRRTLYDMVLRTNVYRPLR